MADDFYFRSPNTDKMREKPKENVWYAAISSCLGSVAFGYMIGYSSPALPDMEWRGVLEKSQLSWFSSLVAVGAIPACFVVGQMLENLGRKWTIVLSSVPYLIGWLSILVANSAFTFYFGRFLTGFATGIVSTAVPVYLTEISSKDNRGFLGALNQLGITLGILIVYALGLICSYWYLALIGLVCPLAYGFMMTLMPESPRWLMTHRSRTEAKSALAWLRNSYTETEREVSEMEDQSSSDQESIGLDDFRKPELRKALTISVGLMLFQQLSGINAVMFNIVDMFLESGFRESGEVAATIVGAVQFIATAFSCLVIDKWGRRFMLISTGLAMSVSCFMFSYYYHVDVKDPSLLLKYTPLISLSIFIVAFSLGWGPVPSLMMSEVFPTRARSIASSVTVLSNWVSAFLITKNYISMKDNLGKDGVFSFFGISILVGSLFVHFFVPETNGKSLEEIQAYFTGKKGILSTSTARNM